MTPRDMRKRLNDASVRELGRPIPAEIRVEVSGRQKRIVLLGPAASGKTRIAQAVRLPDRKGWRCFTGIRPDQLNREWPR